MELISEIIILFFIFLGVVKLAEICLGRKTQKSSFFVRNQFYAELLYKIMKQNKKFEAAPKEVYQWIACEYKKWLEQKR